MQSIRWKEIRCLLPSLSLADTSLLNKRIKNISRFIRRIFKYCDMPENTRTNLIEDLSLTRDWYVDTANTALHTLCYTIAIDV